MSTLLSIIVILIYIPANSVYGFLFCCILANICCLHSWRWPFYLGWDEILVLFWFAFLFGQGRWILLFAFINHLYIFSWKFPIQLMCPLLYWVVDSLVAEFFWVPCRFWILVPYQMNSWQRFSLILWAVS
jgi:hypothetical protein